MEFLKWEDFIFINAQTIERHGGQFVPPENLLNPDRLSYAIEAVQETIFGQRLHASVTDVAAAYIFYVVTGHIFQDGNKRTGLEAGLLFLGLNGAKLQENLLRVTLADGRQIPQESAEGNWILYQLIIELAAGSCTLEELKTWLVANTEER